MSEEEKEAIEFLKKRINEWKKYTKRENETTYDDVVLNLIEKQQKEIEKKDKIIDLMAKYIEDELTVDEFCSKENCYADNYEDGHCQKCLNCMKQYFERKVEEE